MQLKCEGEESEDPETPWALPLDLNMIDVFRMALDLCSFGLQATGKSR